MRIEDIIQKLNHFTFKIKVDKDNQFIKAMNDKLNEYEKIVREFDVSSADDINIMMEKVNCALVNYYKGNIYEASKIINDLLIQYKKKIYIHDLKHEKNINIYIMANDSLYKGRIGNFNKEYCRKDIFHIPFDKRELVKTQRFSIYGVPCIYIGQSLYIVWEELDRPSLEDLYISRYHIDDDLRVLDLGLSGTDVQRIIDKKDEEKNLYNIINNQSFINKFILTNVLKIVCLISVNQKNRSFKSEYIIPQLILMNIVNTGMADGVRYPSVKVEEDSYIFCNYAFPAIQTNKKKNYSTKLSKKIKLTQPVNISLYSSISTLQPKTYLYNLYRSDTRFRVGDEYTTIYGNTMYFKIERSINCDTELKFENIGI